MLTREMSRGALLLLLCLSTFVFGLGRTAITDSDEAFYAQAGREMVDGGNWATPHFNFEPRLNKPILYYWLVAGTYKAIGVSEFAARLWAALSGIGLALVAYAIGRRWIDEASGWLAGAIIGSSTGLVILVRESLPDLPLALFVSVAIWAGVEATAAAFGPRASNSSFSPGTRRQWLLISAGAAALGMITKGPIALAIPFVALAPRLIWERRPSAARAPAIRLTDMMLALLLFVAIAAPWYIAATLEHGTGFLRQFFIGENIERFATTTFNKWRGPWFYPAVVAGGLLPWSAFGLLWLPPLAGVIRRRRSVSPAAAHLVAWVLGPMCLLALSIGSQPRYILPCVVPVALLLAKAIMQRVRAPHTRRDLLLAVASVAGGGTLVAIAVVIWRARPLLLPANVGWTPVGTALIAVSGAVMICAAVLVRRSSLPMLLSTAATVATVSVLATVQRPHRPEPVEQIAAAVHTQPASPLCACGAFARSLTYYTQRPVYVGEYERDLRDFLLRDERVLAVADGDRLDAVERSLDRRFPRLAETTYLNLFDSDRRLQRVVLVSNR